MELVLVTNYNDWEGLYIDGKLVLEGHVIRKDEMLTILGINYTEVEAAEGWLESCGCLPKNLSDVEEG
ncbi:MAG: hypothetical protein GQ553_03725 [Nitrosomonadaceae bacterium]|nr:hypothetical protein [Nitrosomonadaceae bacterium]